MDFLYLGPSTTDQLSVLILRDDFSSFVWLFSGNTADSDTAVDSIAQWIGTFGCMDLIVSDQGSHFKNKIMEGLRKWFRFSHYFTAAYTPWANGTVQRVCRDVKRACMTLLPEWGRSPREWPSVTECVQCILNQAPLKMLGNRTGEVQPVLRCALELFTGMRPCRPLMHALHFKDHENNGSHDEVCASQLLKIEELQGAIEVMHTDVAERVSRRRKNSITAHNKKTNVQSINFSIGDFVLVRVARKKGQKLGFHSRGPRRISNVMNDLVYEVENLSVGAKEIVHATRILLYRVEPDNSEVDPNLIAHACRTTNLSPFYICCAPR